jgi:threonyl-tRNA synthetase
LEGELQRLEEVKLRDHRRLGRELGIFHLSPEVGSGLPLWLPNGTVLRDELEFLAKQYERAAGYERVSTPHIANEKLYYQSGHLPYYQDDMYSPMKIGESNFYLRPMNCPHHHHIYLSRPRSYRDLPVRLAEYGQVYRYEDSGALSGMIRTRGFCQNDAHIYCAVESTKAEFAKVMEMHAELYRLFDISDFYMKLSLPDLDNIDKYIDDSEAWKAALEIVVEAMKESELPYIEVEGEAAFYGPKIDFIIKSAIGTEYAISTNQLDFLASSRFGLTYTGADGQEHPIYVIHRAPLGSHERFIAFLLEHYCGAFPAWLAPVQAMIVPVSERFSGYASSVQARFRSVPVRNGTLGLRVETDLSSDRMQKKIRNAVVAKTPLVLVVGSSEEEQGTVSVRTRDGVDHGSLGAEVLLQALIESVEARNDQILFDALAGARNA